MDLKTVVRQSMQLLTLIEAQLGPMRQLRTINHTRTRRITGGYVSHVHSTDVSVQSSEAIRPTTS